MDRQIIDYKKVGNKIKDIRQQKGITREKLSEIIGISSMYLGQLERGERRGGINNYIEIANALELSLDFLFFDEIYTVDVLDNQILQKLKDIIHNLDNDRKILFLNIVLDIANRINENNNIKDIH